MFLDASAIVCILTAEPEAEQMIDRMEQASMRLTSALAGYEAALAVARKFSWTAEEAAERVLKFCRETNVQIVPMGLDELRLAAQAHDRFGKGRHPARLNMGDCFAYACTRTHNAPLLFKGEDFALTDVVQA